MQVLGLTNYSHWEKAAPLRRCAAEDPKISEVSVWRHVAAFEGHGAGIGNVKHFAGILQSADGLPTSTVLSSSQHPQELSALAKRRLRTFSHVGTTELLSPSVESAAASLGMSLSELGFKGGEVRCSLNRLAV